MLLRDATIGNQGQRIKDLQSSETTLACKSYNVSRMQDGHHIVD